MNTSSYMARRHPGQIAVGTGALLALLAIAPVAAIAQHVAVSGVETPVSTVSLADLDLSTPDGMKAARLRLHQAARRVCIQPAGSQVAPTQAKFAACVGVALADELQQINASMRATIEQSGTWRASSAVAQPGLSPAAAPETLAMFVSVANLDLSTPGGIRIAQQRVRTTSRRLCNRLFDSQDLADKSYANCVGEATVAALRQVDARAVAASEAKGTPLAATR
jgi:UrcA family protein